jgi:hypothetical protein
MAKNEDILADAATAAQIREMAASLWALGRLTQERQRVVTM